MRELDADYSWPKPGNPFVSVGARSSYLCKRPPADVFAQPGDLVNVDFGLRINGFGSDNQRSFYVLRARRDLPPRTKSRMHLKPCRPPSAPRWRPAAPGVYTTVPRDEANEVFESRGYPTVGGLGHELGTFAHEGGMRCGSDYRHR